MPARVFVVFSGDVVLVAFKEDLAPASAFVLCTFHLIFIHLVDWTAVLVFDEFV